MKIDYDKKFDTLSIAITDNNNSYGDDTNEDIIIRRNIDTDEVTGFTILSFQKKLLALKQDKRDL